MKEIKAFIHCNRAADVIHALKEAGLDNLSLADVKGTLSALDAKERSFSLELGSETITELKLELVCEDQQVEAAVAIIRDKGRTGQRPAGWIYVYDIAAAYAIDGEDD